MDASPQPRRMGPDGPTRRFVKALARISFSLNVGLRRRWLEATGRDQWTLAGECHRCGRCCEVPSITVDKFTWRFPRLFLWWQRVVNGFELVQKEEFSRAFVFRCLHYDPATRSCDCYQTRPGMCRDYPRFQMEQARPVLLPGCGYRAVSSDSVRALEVLDMAGLSEAQRAELKKHLRID